MYRLKEQISAIIRIKGEIPCFALGLQIILPSLNFYLKKTTLSIYQRNINRRLDNFLPNLFLAPARPYPNLTLT